jgi:hypothetical protein
MDTSRVTCFVHLQGVQMPTFRGNVLVILTEGRRFLRNLGSHLLDCSELQGKSLSINIYCLRNLVSTLSYHMFQYLFHFVTLVSS